MDTNDCNDVSDEKYFVSNGNWYSPGAVVTTETLVETAGAEVAGTTGTGTLETEAVVTGAASVDDETSTLEYADGTSTADVVSTGVVATGVVSTALVSTMTEVVADGRS